MSETPEPMATLAPSAAGRKRLPAIDMTPMVDLAFLLLAFFVLTTTLTKQKALEMVMPHRTTESMLMPARKVLNLVLGDNDQIHWYSGVDIYRAKTTNFSAQGIRKILMEKKASVKGLFVVIKPSEKSQYKNMVDILDEMMITEIDRYAIVDLEPADKELI